MEWAADAGEAVARAGAGAGAPLVVHVVPAGGRGAGGAGAHPGRVDALRAAGCVGLRVELGSRAAQQLSAFVPLQGGGERVLMIGLGGRVLVECGPDRVADPDTLLQDLERGLQAFEAAQKQEALAAALRVIAAQAAPGASPSGGGVRPRVARPSATPPSSPVEAAVGRLHGRVRARRRKAAVPVPEVPQGQAPPGAGGRRTGPRSRRKFTFSYKTKERKPRPRPGRRGRERKTCRGRKPRPTARTRRTRCTKEPPRPPCRRPPLALPSSKSS